MMDPYDVIIMPWITEKTLEARRIADPAGGHTENNNRIEFIVRRDSDFYRIFSGIKNFIFADTPNLFLILTRSRGRPVKDISFRRLMSLLAGFPRSISLRRSLKPTGEL